MTDDHDHVTSYRAYLFFTKLDPDGRPWEAVRQADFVTRSEALAAARLWRAQALQNNTPGLHAEVGAIHNTGRVATLSVDDDHESWEEADVRAGIAFARQALAAAMRPADGPQPLFARITPLPAPEELNP